MQGYCNDVHDGEYGKVRAVMRVETVRGAGSVKKISKSISLSGNLLPYLVSYMQLRVDSSVHAGSLMWLQTLLSLFYLPFLMDYGNSRCLSL